MPRASRLLGSHEEMRSVMAALRLAFVLVKDTTEGSGRVIFVQSIRSCLATEFEVQRLAQWLGGGIVRSISLIRCHCCAFDCS